MAKKKRPQAAQKPAIDEKSATLKDLLSPEVLNKLKAQANELKAEEAQHKEKLKKQAEEARKAEQKALENNFEHLLQNSKLDWRKYK